MSDRITYHTAAVDQWRPRGFAAAGLLATLRVLQPGTDTTMLERFRLNYRLDLHEGAVRTTRGRAPPRFVTAVSDIARLHAIRHGHIECKGTGHHARLRFSKDFPNKGRQAIRNVWTPPTAPGAGGGPRASG